MNKPSAEAKKRRKLKTSGAQAISMEEEMKIEK